VQAELGSRAGIDRETAHIRGAMEVTSDEHAKKGRACARSKAWWSQEIVDQRKKRGQATRERRQQPAAFREAKQMLRGAIRRAKKGCWNNFAQRADNKDGWTAEATLDWAEENGIAFDKAKMEAMLAEEIYRIGTGRRLRSPV